MQNYTGGFYNMNSKAGDQLCRELCEAIVKAYPDHPYAYNVLAGLSSAKKDEKACIGYLHTALEKAPDDTLVMFNLGDAYKRTGDKASAKKWYENILALHPAADLKTQVEQALNSLK